MKYEKMNGGRTAHVPFDQKMKLKIVKKCLAAGFAAIFLCLCSVVSLAESQTVFMGDANRDGQINAGDARQIIRLAVGLEESDTNDLKVCDVDGDGAIGSSDARVVLRVAVGIESLNGKIVSIGEDAYVEPEPIVEPEPVVEPQPVYDVDPYDMEILAVVVCQEAGGESTELQLLVANVVINRVNSPYFPNTVYGVLTQPWQYARVTSEGGIYWPGWATESIRQDCREVAYRILSGERYLPENVVYQAAFTQGSGVHSYYPGPYGGTYFCYL